MLRNEAKALRLQSTRYYELLRCFHLASLREGWSRPARVQGQAPHQDIRGSTGPLEALRAGGADIIVVRSPWVQPPMGSGWKCAHPD